MVAVGQFYHMKNHESYGGHVLLIDTVDGANDCTTTVVHRPENSQGMLFLKASVEVIEKYGKQISHQDLIDLKRPPIPLEVGHMIRYRSSSDLREAIVVEETENFLTVVDSNIVNSYARRIHKSTVVSNCRPRVQSIGNNKPILTWK